MKNQIITKKDIFTPEFDRDCNALKFTIRLLMFLNAITFGLIEKRLEYQLDIIYGLWIKKLENGDYFVKKGIDFSDTNKLVDELTEVINQN